MVIFIEHCLCKLLFREFESSFLKAIASQALRRLMSIILLDLFIIITMMLIPAAIVKQLETCMSYGGKSIVIPNDKNFCKVINLRGKTSSKIIWFSDSAWYVFQTITTIGFGDVIAGSDYNDWCLEEGSKDNIDFTFLFWVGIYLIFIIERSTLKFDLISTNKTLFIMPYIF